MDTAIKAASPTPSPPTAGGRRPPRHLWFPIATAIVGPTLALVYAGVFGDILPGQAMVFDHWMFSGLVALGCLVALLFWFVILSGYPRAVRWRVLGVLVVVLAIAYASGVAVLQVRRLHRRHDPALGTSRRDPIDP